MGDHGRDHGEVLSNHDVHNIAAEIEGDLDNVESGPTASPRERWSWLCAAKTTGTTSDNSWYWHIFKNKAACHIRLPTTIDHERPATSLDGLSQASERPKTPCERLLRYPLMQLRLGDPSATALRTSKNDFQRSRAASSACRRACRLTTHPALRCHCCPSLPSPSKGTRLESSTCQETAA